MSDLFSKRKLILFVHVFFIAVLLSGCANRKHDASGTELQILCFSAGKADAFLLTTESGTVLIDAGEKSFGSEIAGYLEDAGIAGIDYLIITHFDKDHVGGAGKIIDSVPVGTVLQSNCPKDSSSYNQYVSALENASIEPVTVRKPYSFTLDGVSYLIDPPRQDNYEDDDSNNSSLIISVTNGKNKLLFTGDAQNGRLEEFLSANKGRYDFLKVPYHGRWMKRLDDLIGSVRPAYAVITSSDDDMEDERTTGLLSELGVKTFLTRIADVLVTCNGETISVQYQESKRR